MASVGQSPAFEPKSACLPLTLFLLYHGAQGDFLTLSLNLSEPLFFCLLSGHLSTLPSEDLLWGFAQYKMPSTNYTWQNKCSITSQNYYSTNSHINSVLMTPEVHFQYWVILQGNLKKRMRPTGSEKFRFYWPMPPPEVSNAWPKPNLGKTFPSASL